MAWSGLIQYKAGRNRLPWSGWKTRFAQVGQGHMVIRKCASWPESEPENKYTLDLEVCAASLAPKLV